jgi:hypothetical protein
MQPTDCASGVCTANLCVAASCSDGVKNQGETDTDCGGPCDPAQQCADGKSCLTAADCQSGVCDAGTLTCTATFAVTVSIAPDSSVGSVASTSPASPTIDCPATACTQTYASGTSVTLAATPVAPNTFDKWTGGPCDGSTSATCTFSVGAAVTMSAAFK